MVCPLTENVFFFFFFQKQLKTLNENKNINRINRVLKLEVMVKK